MEESHPKEASNRDIPLLSSFFAFLKSFIVPVNVRERFGVLCYFQEVPHYFVQKTKVDTEMSFCCQLTTILVILVGSFSPII